MRLPASSGSLFDEYLGYLAIQRYPPRPELAEPQVRELRANGRRKIRPAQTSAFCSSVTTPEISLNGFVYWFA